MGRGLRGSAAVAQLGGQASAGPDLAFCVFALLAASPAWKVLLGTLLLQLSVAPTPPAAAVAYPPARSV